ncbi:hypothetical protein GCM10010421_41180 [Streptomyces glaucus]|uniref:Secreted protein n=1 Tax=Streptomyces glaucus TaxID=284029 RepID=A0ABN3K3M3_9ACTN
MLLHPGWTGRRTRVPAECGEHGGAPLPSAVDPGGAEQTWSTVCGSTADGVGAGVSDGWLQSASVQPRLQERRPDDNAERDEGTGKAEAQERVREHLEGFVRLSPKCGKTGKADDGEARQSDEDEAQRCHSFSRPSDRLAAGNYSNHCSRPPPGPATAERCAHANGDEPLVSG